VIFWNKNPAWTTRALSADIVRTGADIAGQQCPHAVARHALRQLRCGRRAA
jgi:hypothetical protein